MRRTQIQIDDRTTHRVAGPDGECEGVRTLGVEPWVRLLALLALIALVGCGGGSGGSAGSGDAGAAIQVDPTYLEPGVTSATLEWQASRGAVESYLVFESRNGATFGYSTMTVAPSVQIDGQAGDSVQITVVALSPYGQMSESSPPSAPIIFQAAPSASAAAVAAPESASAMPLAANSESATTAANTTDAGTTSDASATGPEAVADETNADAAVASRQPLSAGLREMLLRGEARLPVGVLSTTAAAWLQAHVDAEVGAGVSLVGTGRDDEDELIELVWQDQAGQLFVSEGARALEATDLSTTLDEGLRLSATERFAGFEDLDGDGVADWLIEDPATEIVWIVDGDSGLARAAVAIAPFDRLVGPGDFDGDGRTELLWRSESGRLSATRASADATAEAPIPLLEAVVPEGFELLAIADLDGDGRDDVLGLNDRGSLEVGFAAGPPGSTPLGLAWRDAGLAPLDGRELVATLDTDDDGAAELALLAGDSVELLAVGR